MMIPKLSNEFIESKDKVIYFHLERQGNILNLIAEDGEDLYDVLQIRGDGIYLDENIPRDFGIPVDKDGRIKIHKEDRDAQQR